MYERSSAVLATGLSWLLEWLPPCAPQNPYNPLARGRQLASEFLIPRDFDPANAGLF